MRPTSAACLVACFVFATFAACTATTVDDLQIDASLAASASEATDSVLADEDHTVPYQVSAGDVFFEETFQGSDPFKAGVVKSKADKYKHQMVDIAFPKLYSGIQGDKGLNVAAGAKHYGVVMPFSEPLEVADDEELVFQYEVRLQDGLECGGAYIKVPAADPKPDLTHLDNDTPYVVMFGPDKCGATNKVHFILRHENPVSHVWSEHHFKEPPMPKADKHSHLYTLIIRPDNTFDIKIDDASVASGNLLNDMEPPINPPEEIDDPEDEKPDDWVDEAQIADPEATKPEDWDEDAPATILDMDAEKPAGWLDDEVEYIPDPASEKPEEWDDEDDGEWEAPQVPNPKCEEAPGCGEWIRPSKANPDFKGKWSAPMIDNPDYIGEWAPRKIPNEAFFVDENPARLPRMAGVAVEIWTMSANLFFDNFVVANSAKAASAFAQKTWAVKHTAQVAREEAMRAQLARKQREEAFRDGGFMGKLNYFVLEGADWAVQNPVVTAVSLVAVLLSFIYLCCMGGDAPQRTQRQTYRTPKAPASPNADNSEPGQAQDTPAEASADEDDDAEQNEESDSGDGGDGGDDDESGDDEDGDDGGGDSDGSVDGGASEAKVVRRRRRKRTVKQSY